MIDTHVLALSRRACGLCKVPATPCPGRSIIIIIYAINLCERTTHSPGCSPAPATGTLFICLCGGYSTHYSSPHHPTTLNSVHECVRFINALRLIGSFRLSETFRFSLVSLVHVENMSDYAWKCDDFALWMLLVEKLDSIWFFLFFTANVDWICVVGFMKIIFADTLELFLYCISIALATGLTVNLNFHTWTYFTDIFYDLICSSVYNTSLNPN